MNDSMLKNLPEFANHRCVLFLEDKETGLTAFIAIHRGGIKYPAFGATRLWNYATPIDGLQDALRLSTMMSYKSAMAGLPYGGAKAVIISPGTITSQKKRRILTAYAERLNYLRGGFITGTDMGLQASDLVYMKEKTPYLVGFSIDPTIYTAMGMIAGLHICLKEIFGKNDIAGKTFAIEGMGKIGIEFLKNIYPQATKIFVSDLKNENTQAAKKLFPKIEVVRPDDLRKLKVDVYSPCGSSGSLNSTTASQFRCKIILGGANNQLENIKIAEKIHRSGILYAPDYVVNAGGLISVTHEFQHKKINKPLLEKKVKKIGTTLKNIFTESKKNNISPQIVANTIAEIIMANRF